MTTLKKTRVASLAVSMPAVTIACSGPISPASSVAADGGGAPTESSAASATTSASDKIKIAGVLRVGVKVSVPDFGLKNTETDEVEGFEADLAKVIAKDLLSDEGKMGTQAVTARTRGLLLDSREIDLVIAAFTIIDERKKAYNFSNPCYSDVMKPMVKKDSGIKSLKDLDGKTIGIAQSSTNMKAIQNVAGAAGMKVKLDKYATHPEIKAALDSDRVQCFSVDGSILSGYADDTTTVLDGKYSPQEYGIADKLDNKDLTEHVNGMVVQLKSSRELDQVIAKWKLD